MKFIRTYEIVACSAISPRTGKRCLAYLVDFGYQLRSYEIDSNDTETSFLYLCDGAADGIAFIPKNMDDELTAEYIAEWVNDLEEKESYPVSHADDFKKYGIHIFKRQP